MTYLKAVEVEQEHRELLTPPALARARVLDFFNRGGAVGEAGEGVVVRHEGDALLGPFPLGDVFDDEREVFRLVMLVTNDDAAGRQHARAALRYFHFVFGRGHAAVELNGLAVRLVEYRRVMRAVNILRMLAYQCRVRQADHGLELPVHKCEFEGLGVLDDDGNRNVLDDRIEKTLGLIQFLRGKPLFGDVFVRRDPAAALHGPVNDGDEAPVGELADALVTLVRHDLVDPLIEALCIILPPGALGSPIDKNLAQSRARFRLFFGQPIYLGVLLIADDQPLRGVVHRQALRHVFHGGVESHVLR